MISLIDPSKNYKLDHPLGVSFEVRNWTVAMQDEVDRRCIKVTRDGSVSYDTALERELRIDLSIVGWSGIENDPACTSEAKRLLPVGVIVWLQREIEDRAGLRISLEEKKN